MAPRNQDQFRLHWHWLVAGSDSDNQLGDCDELDFIHAKNVVAFYRFVHSFPMCSTGKKDDNLSICKQYYIWVEAALAYDLATSINGEVILTMDWVIVIDEFFHFSKLCHCVLLPCTFIDSVYRTPEKMLIFPWQSDAALCQKFLLCPLENNLIVKLPEGNDSDSGFGDCDELVLIIIPRRNLIHAWHGSITYK